MTLKGQCSDVSKPGLQAPGGAEQGLSDGSGHSQCQSGGKRRTLGQEVAWKVGLKLVRCRHLLLCGPPCGDLDPGGRKEGCQVLEGGHGCLGTH